jgi:two-component system, sensor histidine kinase
MAAERVRVLFGSYTSRELVLAPPIFALLVCCVVAWFGQINWWIAGAWVAVIGAVDQLLKYIDRLFERSNPPENRLAAWSLTRTAISTAHGLAWGLGPIVLHVPGEASSVIVPIWGASILSSMSVYSTSCYPLTMVAVITAAMVPAGIWLLAQGGHIETLSATCMLIVWVVTLLIGFAASRNANKFINSRLDIADLLEQQKIQTKLIQDAHAERTRFFSAASHDLRQPLHALGFYISLAESAMGETDRREVLSRLSECANSLDRQFNAIMGVAESDSAVEHAMIRPTNLQEVLNRVDVSVRPEAEYKQLRFRISQTDLTVMAAPELLERVIVNLASNGVRYTPRGGVLIGVRRSADYAHIWVADTGIGIAEGDRDRIFMDFVQVGNPERNREQGFGLGLAIVRRLCLGLGWKITLHSKVGKGSIFVVRVPLANTSQAVAVESSYAQTTLPQLQRSDVLFVDDDPLVRDAVARMLEGWGMVTHICRTGDEALAILARKHPFKNWYILLDHRLAEGETGLEVAAKINALYGNAAKIVLLTGETDHAVLEEAQNRGIGVLRKPLKPIRLRAALSAPFDEMAPTHGI